MFRVDGMSATIKAKGEFSVKNIYKLKSNNILLITCAEYQRCRPYSEMLTYEPVTNNAVVKVIQIRIRDKSNK
jgi:hypothetical protein